MLVPLSAHGVVGDGPGRESSLGDWHARLVTSSASTRFTPNGSPVEECHEGIIITLPHSHRHVAHHSAFPALADAVTFCSMITSRHLFLHIFTIPS